MLQKKRIPQILRLILPILLVINFALSTGADESFIRKLDPALKPLLLGGASAAAPSAKTSMPSRDSDMINAIVKISGDPAALKSSGARIRSVIGDIVTADIPKRSLADFIALPNVVYVQLSHQVEPTLLDESVPETRADQVWRSVPGYTGKGVIVGVIDGGVDWKHPDFKGEDGTTRILYIWDQTVQTPGQSPDGYGYGTEWTKAHIDSGQCREMDATSHGTHTASTMAGSGGSRHNFSGMAPEANLVVVKSTFENAGILDAAYYIFQKAEEMNLPAVINMSFGSHWGPHDGTALMDQALDMLLDRPGRAIAASAGNDGSYSLHLGTSSLRSPVGNKYPWCAIEPSMSSELIAFEAWYPPSRLLGVRLLLPENEAGDLKDMNMGWVYTGQFRHFTVSTGPLAGATVTIDAQLTASDQVYPNFSSIYIAIYNNGDITIPIDEYLYAVEYNGFGVSLDAYVVSGGRFAPDLPASPSFPDTSYLIKGDANKTIISPSSASRVICVGSYITRDEWIDSENRIRSEDLKIGDISAFSSIGPLINGDRKPDLAAPGEMVVAAFSADSWGRSRSVYRDSDHIALRGTSMSSPHVAGAVALIYQQNPNLTALAVKDILNGSAVDVSAPGWDKVWGYGRLDTLAALGIPAAPSSARATAGDGSVTLIWSPNEESDIAGYKVYAATDAGHWMVDTGFWMTNSGQWALDGGCWKLDSGVWVADDQCWMKMSAVEYQASSIRFQLSNLENGVSISLSVSAYGNDGDEGPVSQEITVAPDPANTDVTPPDAPSDLSVTSINTALDVKWSPVTVYDLSRYKIYYGTSPGNYTKNASVGKQTNYRLENLTNGQRVYVAVSSVDTSGNESEKSKEVSAVPQLFQKSEMRYQSGWPVSTVHDVYSSPALYDIDGDGRLEVSVSSRDGKVYLLTYNGQNAPGWPISTGSASVSSPALGDFDGDGSVEIVVGAGKMVYMWHKDGSPMNGWPVQTGDTVIASPALGDIDGDGELEVVIGSRDRRVHAYNGDGSRVKGWPVWTDGYVQSSAAIGDVDGDSRMEIVVGSEDANVYVFNGDGTMAQGWPVFAGGAVYSSPALGDIDSDGSLEIVVSNEGGAVFAWHYDGDPVNGWPVDLREATVSSPALGDIDGDPVTLEIVIGTLYGSVYALKSDGSAMSGWPVSVMDSVYSSPALADINSDGNADVIVCTSMGHSYIGLVYAFSSSGKSLGSLWPVFTEGNICYSSPALGDLDGDGDIELVVGSCRQVYAEGGQIHAWDLSGRATGESIVWGGFRHDHENTGVADDTAPPSFTIAILQNPALEKHLNIYIVASEQIVAAPDMSVDFSASKTGQENFVRPVPLVLLDAEPRLYKANFTVEYNGIYTFTVSGIDLGGNVGNSSKSFSVDFFEKQLMAPSGFSLLPNYPNPFNPGTWIPYKIPQDSAVTIDIYSVAGQLIRSLKIGHRPAGSYTDKTAAAYWDGTDDSEQEMSSGLYFCVLKAGKFTAVRKMILSK